MGSVQKFYPTAEELSTVNMTVRCPEDGCSSIFMSESNLNLHLAKTHKKENLMVSNANVTKEYYCPELSCSYNNAKSFKAMKFLKQHYLKVHCLKTYECETCDMKFSTQSAKNSHTEYCNAKFTCSECSSSYGTYESLITHGRRKKHKILDKSAFKTVSIAKPAAKSSSITNLSQTVKKNTLLLPKASTSLHEVNYNSTSNLIMYEKGSQTDIWTEKPRLSKKMSKPVNNSQETQTLKQHLSTETQTIGDYFTKKSSKCNLNEKDLCRKNINTQTKPVDSTTKSCNTCFSLSDFHAVSDNADRNNSETQTTSEMPPELLYSTPQNTHYSTHTDTTDLNEFEFLQSRSQTRFNEAMDTFDTENYLNCNSSETQTDLMSVFNTDYCSNTYTQTCDNLLLNELSFMNSHTQTVSDDVLRSVESQTMMSARSPRTVLSCRDTAHMETQTDGELKRILEEDLCRKNIKTQTKPIDSATKSCNTCFSLSDFNFVSDGAERNNSETQTTSAVPPELLYSTQQSAHYSTHTDTADLNEFDFIQSRSRTVLKEEMDTFDSDNYLNCNIETQTDFMSMFTTDYCSNMYTQTCDNLLLNELGFMNSHTQTLFDDVLRSVESQTVMSAQPSRIVLNCRDMTHMETQTDVEFQQILEEINA